MFESKPLLCASKKNVHQSEELETTDLNDKLILKNILYSADSAIIATDLNYRIIYSNPATEKILDYRFDASSKSLITDVCSRLALEPEYLEKITDEIHTEGSFQFSIKLDKGDALKCIECKFSGIWNEHRVLIGFLLMAQDVSEREKGFSVIRAHRAELAQVARLNVMAEMASSLAHELNQPLTVISSYCDAALNLIDNDNVPCSDRVINALRQSRSQALRAGEIIRSIRQLVRKEEGERRSVNINNLLGNVIELVETDIHDQKIVLRCYMDSELPWVSVDGIQVEQVILNLLRNAVESMEAYGELIISTALHEDGEKIIISILDDGAGFSEEISDRLFDPFFTTKANGLGMGLSISKNIVEAHGGSLCAENIRPHGALFCLTLPVAVNGK
ncbi:MAG: ATP-binding protein [Gammaproteobacteria bacterium]|nr:ATP-binding protein [Gammaproteobacteria bacterium]